MAANATFALKAGVWVRRVRLLIVSPDSTGTTCPQSGRNSTYPPVQISGAGSIHTRCALVGATLGIGVGQDVLAADLVVQGVETIAGFCLRFRVQRHLQFLNT